MMCTSEGAVVKIAHRNVSPVIQSKEIVLHAGIRLLYIFQLEILTWWLYHKVVDFIVLVFTNHTRWQYLKQTIY